MNPRETHRCHGARRIGLPGRRDGSRRVLAGRELPVMVGNDAGLVAIAAAGLRFGQGDGSFGAGGGRGGSA